MCLWVLRQWLCGAGWPWGDSMSSQVLHEPVWPVVRAVQSPWAWHSVPPGVPWGGPGKLWDQNPKCKGLRSKAEESSLQSCITDGQSTDPVRVESRGDATGGGENGNLLFYLCKLLIQTHCAVKLPGKFSFSCYCGRKSRKSICFQQPVCIYLLFELLKRPVAENVFRRLEKEFCGHILMFKKLKK